jgi:uncharacterized membrane protein
MTIQDLGSLGEFVAAIATIATLIYLAIQIRQNSESIRMSAETEVSKQFAEWASLVVNNPEIGRIWDAAADDPKALTDDEIRQFLWFAFELLLLCEAQYHLYLKGHMTEESWSAKANMFLGFINNPIISKWWDTGLGPLSPQFREYVEQNRNSVSLSWEYANVAKSGRLDT